MKTKEFIEKAKIVHNNKYDYSKVEYVNAHTKVCIICPEHGEFWQTPNNHTHKTRPKGCPKCAGNGKLTTEEFISKAKSVHGDKYDYSKVEYVNTSTPVCIICPIHGEFWQTPNHHLGGNECPKCTHQSYKHTTESFIEEAKKVHGDKYDYSKVEYANSHTKVCIICPEHGEFWQTPTNHMKGRGCPSCKAAKISNMRISSREHFIKKAIKVHGCKYDYSKVNYVNSSTKVCIICPEHGEFWQTPNQHLRGNGCRLCRESHLEREMRVALSENNIKFIVGHHFKWLGRQHIDFYLPDYDIGIECQGEQHFVKANRFNTKRTLEEIIERDTTKNRLCNENNVTILYYTNDKIYHLTSDKPSIYSNNLFITTDSILQKIRGM